MKLLVSIGVGPTILEYLNSEGDLRLMRRETWRVQRYIGVEQK